MLAKAISKYIRISPYKLRPYADVIRGKSVEKAYAWLKTCAVQRAEPLLKTLASAYANAKVKNPNLGVTGTFLMKFVKISVEIRESFLSYSLLFFKTTMVIFKIPSVRFFPRCKLFLDF